MTSSFYYINSPLFRFYAPLPPVYAALIKVILPFFVFVVSAPPASIEMIGFAAGSEAPINENQELKLECHVRKSKPAARIVWYRGVSELKLGKQLYWNFLA